MSIEDLLNYSTDSRVINHYLQLLAQRQVQLENQVKQLIRERQQQQLQMADLALINHTSSPPIPTVIVDQSVEPELMEQLLLYLPSIFPNFWSIVSPDELAQMLGLKEKPVIASPYTYPDFNTIQKYIVQIQNQSKQVQAEIVRISFDLQTKYPLKVHSLWLQWLKQYYSAS